MTDVNFFKFEVALDTLQEIKPADFIDSEAADDFKRGLALLEQAHLDESASTQTEEEPVTTPLELYIIVLEGQGDLSIKLVDKETWGWIQSPADPCPPAVMQRYQRHHGTSRTPHISAGSSDNDAALQAPPVEINDEEAAFSSVMDAIAFIRKHDIHVVDEYQGDIY